MSSKLPDGWQDAKLGDVIALEYGRSLPESTRRNGSVPVYGSNGVVGWHDEALVPSGGLIVGRKGTAGSVTASNEPFWPIDTTYFVKPLQQLDWDWLAATLQHARLNELNEATGVPGLNRDKAYRHAILLPPLDEQRRIADVLRSVEEAISAIGDLLDGVKATKQGTMEAVLSEGFNEVRLETLLANTRYPMRSGPFGSALLKSELQPAGIPFLGIDNVHAERFVPVYRRFVSDQKYRELERYTVYPGDVMVTIMGTVGRCCVVPPEVGIAISSKHVWTLTIDQDRYSPALLGWQINYSPRVLEQLQGSAQGGIMSAISSGTLRDLLVPLPTPAEVRRVEELLLSFNAQIAALEAEQDQVKALKSAVVSDLLSGRVRVPVKTVGTTKPVPSAFKRAVFAAEIVNQLHNDSRFGSVKHEKIVHLCELHLGLQDDLDRHAYKKAAGPYDPKARRSVERIFQQQKWFDATKPDGNRVVYSPLEKAGGHAEYFDRYFGGQKPAIQSIIDLMRPLDTPQCEIVATLYAVWNDFLIDGQQPTDDEIVASVLQWHPKKQEISEDRWSRALPWMRQKGLVPQGVGEKTRVAKA
ncbi:hypothetical protein ASD64_16805 [Mesorhizobium sp. Root157]|uniref:restriction endonuclease subunit S n=1 Tax=Mesorhizobium sp. Root157 TaxID=1736477 RepID=UPI0006F2FA76|nr:restriction endonuclease subunit S [Mesorhizobium sp. Root157]KQZ96481.1 hypothetical protein ASD64_16805 [Mesorhizobium sp. Root157]